MFPIFSCFYCVFVIITFYSYSSEFFHSYKGNHTNAPVLVMQPWRIWVKITTRREDAIKLCKIYGPQYLVVWKCLGLPIHMSVSIVASELTANSTVCSTSSPGQCYRKHQSSTSLVLCEENPLVTSWFPSQMASNAENVSMSRCYNDGSLEGALGRLSN